MLLRHIHSAVDFVNFAALSNGPKPEARFTHIVLQAGWIGI